jgi:formamidopyrimidine-DNA glycosylase
MDLVSNLPDSSTRVVFVFSDNTKVYFNDQRKFGWVKLIPTAEIYNESLISKLGPEPKDFHTQESKDHIQLRFGRSARPVKAALLDQAVMAGVGNIYADESLHLAKIHPLRPAKSLDERELRDLMRAVSEVIEKSIEVGGTSFTNYVNVLGTRGDYLETSRVFKREGQPCRECGTDIIKTRVAGRGTHICLVCQPVPN